MRALLSKITILSIIASLMTSAAIAQTGSFNSLSERPTTAPYQHVTPSYAPTPHSPIEHHASTVFGDVGKAVAAIMKAYTNGEMDLAQARILNAQAYSLWQQNRIEVVNAHYAIQKTREYERRQKHLRDIEWAKQMEERKEQRGRELLSIYRPRRSEFNRETGEIFWPMVFDRPEMAHFRHDMEGLFEGLATEGPQYDGIYRDTIAEKCIDFMNMLADQREAYGLSWDSYFAAKRLVRGLALEAEFWTDGQDMGHYGSRYNQLASN